MIVRIDVTLSNDIFLRPYWRASPSRRLSEPIPNSHWMEIITEPIHKTRRNTQHIVFISYLDMFFLNDRYQPVDKRWARSR